MNKAADEHGGRADVNPVQDLGFLYNGVSGSLLDGNQQAEYSKVPKTATGRIRA